MDFVKNTLCLDGYKFSYWGHGNWVNKCDINVSDSAQLLLLRQHGDPEAPFDGGALLSGSDKYIASVRNAAFATIVVSLHSTWQKSHLSGGTRVSRRSSKNALRNETMQ